MDLFIYKLYWKGVKKILKIELKKKKMFYIR